MAFDVFLFGDCVDNCLEAEEGEHVLCGEICINFADNGLPQEDK